MTFDFDRVWFEKAVKLEQGKNVTAGLPAPLDMREQEHSENRIAFSRIVSWARRNDRLTAERLAKNLDLDVDEIVAIENNPYYTVEPRSIMQIARYLKVQPQALMKLAGLTVDRTQALPESMVREAAHSVSSATLTQDERRLFEEFIAALKLCQE
jgi:DNA-binding XRE family transcriptional regulator